MNINTKVDISDAIKVPRGLKAAVEKQIESTGSGPFDDMFRQWAKRYETFVRRHFNDASRGNGDWAPLAMSTIDRRLAGTLGKGTRAGLRQALQFRLRKGIKSDSTRYTVRQKIARLASRDGVAILKNTGSLFAALIIGGPGNYLKRGKARIVYGFADTRHPGKGRATLAQIAAFHDAGGGHLPQRKILIKPDKRLIDSFVGDAKRAVTRVLATLKAGA